MRAFHADARSLSIVGSIKETGHESKQVYLSAQSITIISGYTCSCFALTVFKLIKITTKVTLSYVKMTSRNQARCLPPPSEPPPPPRITGKNDEPPTARSLPTTKV